MTDARDRVYLFNRSVHPLMVLDRDGTFRTSWGDGILSSAHGMCIDPQENLYLPVIGRRWRRKGSEAWSTKARSMPEGVAPPGM